MTDWREQCVELEGLLTKLHELVLADARFLLDEDSGAGIYGVELDISIDESLARTRVALAQPEPEGLTDEELNNLANKAWISVDVRKEYDLIENAFDCCSFARAAIAADRARYGRPAIKPVPVRERLPGEGDCDAEGRCWIGTWNHIEDEDVFELLFDWSFSTPRDWTWSGIAHIQYWLPHYALPVPTSQKIP
jgi:hypothetical protein